MFTTCSLKDIRNAAEDIKEEADKKLLPHLFILRGVQNGETKFYAKTNLEELILEVSRTVNTYDESYSFEVDTLSIRYTENKKYTIELDKDQIAYGSKETVIKHDNGFYSCTLKTIKKDCVSLAYGTWLNYINSIISPSFSSSVKTLQDIPVPSRVVTDVSIIDPIETINKVCLLYSKEHVHLILHKNYITKNGLTYLNWRAKPQFLSVIRPTTIKEDNSFINTMDIESIREEPVDSIIHHKPYFISYYINSVSGYYKGNSCIEEMFTYLANNAQDLTIWMHYGGKYDTHFILDRVKHVLNYKLSQPIEVIDTNGRIIRLIIHTYSCKIEIRDSFSITLTSLAKLCESFKVSMPKINMDSTKFKEEDFDRQDVIDYGVRDSIALHQCLQKYNDIKELPNATNYCTITAMSKNIFYSKYYKYGETFISELNYAAYKYIRRSYKGGIVRCFNRGIFQDIYSYDLKSSYPYAGTKLLPCGSLKHGYVYGKITCVEDLPDYMSFIRCKVYPKPTKYKIPIHIYHDNDGLEVEEPGEFIQTLFSEEIKLGLQYGYTYYMYECVTFNQSYPLLREFNKDMYKLKFNAEVSKDTVKRHIYKLLLNSCYGYFGFNNYDKKVLRVYNNTPENIIRCKTTEDAGESMWIDDGSLLYSTQQIDVDMPRTNVAIASAITSYARMRLFELGKDIQDRGFDVYYCDTDCVKTNMPETPSDSCLYGKNLGDVDKEMAEFDPVEVCLYKKKVYTSIHKHKETGELKYTVKCKGVDTSKIVDDSGTISKSVITDVIEGFKHSFYTGDSYNVKTSNINCSKTDRCKGYGIYERLKTYSIKV